MRVSRYEIARWYPERAGASSAAVERPGNSRGKAEKQSRGPEWPLPCIGVRGGPLSVRSLVVRDLKKLLPLIVVVGALVASASAGDLRITLPKRTKPTPVQNLNREGVKAVSDHNYEKAKRLFYKAYLLDPDDPFTLNNLGYIAELEGDVERAALYYDLSQQMESDALVDKSTSEDVIGKSVASVAGNAE